MEETWLGPNTQCTWCNENAIITANSITLGDHKTEPLQSASNIWKPHAVLSLLKLLSVY